jgi:Family of unknown function (DUF6152)
MIGGSKQSERVNKMNKAGFAFGLAGILLATAPALAWAHHSHAMYDASKEATVQGVVKSFVYANPHVYLILVTQNDGKTGLYQVEMSFTGNMERQGMNHQTFKPGDKVSVRVFPLRDGRLGGSYNGAIDAAGHKYGNMADTPQRGG